MFFYVKMQKPLNVIQGCDQIENQAIGSSDYQAYVPKFRTVLKDFQVISFLIVKKLRKGFNGAAKTMILAETIVSTTLGS